MRSAMKQATLIRLVFPELNIALRVGEDFGEEFSSGSSEEYFHLGGLLPGARIVHAKIFHVGQKLVQFVQNTSIKGIQFHSVETAPKDP